VLLGKPCSSPILQGDLSVMCLQKVMPWYFTRNLYSKECVIIEITTGMIVFPIAPYKSQSCDLNRLLGRLHNQKWIFSAPIGGENKRIAVFTSCQQTQRCESIPVES